MCDEGLKNDIDVLTIDIVHQTFVIDGSVVDIDGSVVGIDGLTIDIVHQTIDIDG